MNVPFWVWAVTVAALVLVLGFGLWRDRKPHDVSMRESATAVAVYVGLAVLFGLGIWFFSGGSYAGQFFAGFLTEYSLSIDNLFVFVVIMTRFAVPHEQQHKVLLVGVMIALVLRAICIAAGAAVIARFQWVFFLFGLALLITGIQMLRHRNDEESEYKENAVIRLVRRVVPVTPDFQGGKLLSRENGKRYMTPLLLVMVAIGTTDVLFALDSIPAIFGLTKEPYLVLTANVFALMGLRQLYFLLGGLLDRLIYLSTGLAIVLLFIAVKLVLEALHGYHVPHIPVVPIWLSLTVIVVVIGVTTVISLRVSARRQRAERGVIA